MTWSKLPAIKANHNPCLNCPDPPNVLPMDGYLAVGFGDAHLEKDGKYILGEHDKEDWITFQECENIASKDPEHDWRIVLFGPLHGQVYQRHDVATWICVEQNEGFE